MWYNWDLTKKNQKIPLFKSIGGGGGGCLGGKEGGSVNSAPTSIELNEGFGGLLRGGTTTGHPSNQRGKGPYCTHIEAGEKREGRNIHAMEGWAREKSPQPMAACE